MMNNRLQMPLIAMRGMTILPGMIVHFDVNRAKSIKALELAMVDDQMVFLLTQKDPSVQEPKEEDLYRIGIVANIKQLIKLPDGTVRVQVEGLHRAELADFIHEEETYMAHIDVMEQEETDLEANAAEAMMRIIKNLMQQFGTENPKMNQEALKQLEQEKDLQSLLNKTASLISLDFESKQLILESVDIISQYETMTKILSDEIEINAIRKELQKKVRDQVDKNQKDYILREQMKVIREELGEDNTLSDVERYQKALSKLKADKEIKDKIKKEIERFQNIASNSSESSVARAYIETLLEMPWKKASVDNTDIKNAAFILGRDHYGLEKVKERILEFLAVRTLTKGKGDSPIVCLVGPPGTGKTSIAKSVAEALGKEYVRISLGGVHDEAEIRGHRRTYVGAMPGRIASGLKHAGVNNPLMLLDEIDKLGNDYKGDPASAMLEVLDSEQNSKFRDHYIELPIDLSGVLFLATANSVQTIPRPLLDRMELIEVTSYTENEKMHIAQDHLLEKQKKRNGLSSDQLTISTKALQKIICSYTREAGVRSLERKIGEINRKAAKEILDYNKKAVRITDKNLEKYLGKEKYTIDPMNETDEIGIVRGLAWTSVGGDTLQIEVNVMPGKGNTQLTGQMGDVMQESAKTALSYIRSIAPDFAVAEDYFEKHDIHIHIPEGAVPKDGPSAGITMATAMLSAVIEVPVKASIAMTGEITLRGRVLPIGGLKEKILAAKAAGIKTVLVPAKNKRDVEEISPEIKKGISIIFVETMDDVRENALVETSGEEKRSKA